MIIKTDVELQQDVETELRWDPKVNAAQIGVTVDGGAVRLLGSVDTYAAMLDAEDAAKRVSGCRSVERQLAVKLPSDHQRTDADIAAAALSALCWDVNIPPAVTASVRDGVLTLHGEVHWHYERQAAENAVRSLWGLIAVYNGITLEQDTSVEAIEVHTQIRAALQRQATQDANSIHVAASGGKVTLTGHATSWQAIDDATHAAWAARGVTEVIDHVKRQTGDVARRQ